jgi:putative inorganic carbon (hco3(-)) transporter
MHTRSSRHSRIPSHLFWLILATILGAALSGFAILFLSSSAAPLVVIAAVGGVVFIAFCLIKPVIALYTALFFSLIPAGMIQPETYHSWVNRGLVVLAMGVWIFGVITRREKIRILPSSILALVFIGWGLISLLWSTTLSAGTQQLQVYIMRFVIFLLLIPNMINTRKRLNQVMGVIALDGLALLLTCVWILATNGYSPGARFTIYKVNENMVGVATMITLTGVLWQAANKRKHVMLWNILAGIYLLFAIGITALSGSRGSTISLVVVLAAFFLWKSTRRWAVLALVFLLIAVLNYPAMFTTMVERFLLTQGDTLLNGREFTWQASWMVIESSPLIGTGIGGSRYAILPYLAHIFSDPLSGAAVHNPILTLWVETGLFGLFLYLSVPLVAIFSYLKSFRIAKRANDTWLLPYFAIVSSIALGYFVSWYIGGGLQSDFSYFIVLTFLLLPAVIQKEDPYPADSKISTVARCLVQG